MSNLKSIPESVYIGGSIYLSGSRNIKKLSDGLIVNGALDISETCIEKLPENLVVNGDLNIKDTHIRAIPINLKVGGKILMDLGPW